MGLGGGDVTGLEGGDVTGLEGGDVGVREGLGDSRLVRRDVGLVPTGTGGGPPAPIDSSCFCTVAGRARVGRGGGVWSMICTKLAGNIPTCPLSFDPFHHSPFCSNTVTCSPLINSISSIQLCIY